MSILHRIISETATLWYCNNRLMKHGGGKKKKKQIWGKNAKIDTTFAHVTWHHTSQWSPFSFMLPLSLSFFPPSSRWFPLSIFLSSPETMCRLQASQLSISVVKKGIGGFFVFRWLSICLAGVEGRKLETPLLPSPRIKRGNGMWGYFPNTPYRATVPSVSESHSSPTPVDFLAPGRSRPSPPLPSVVVEINHTTP